MASLGGMWAPIAQHVLRQAVGSTVKISKVLLSKAGSAARTFNSQLHPVAARADLVGRGAHPIHPSAFLRQQKRGGGGKALRWYSNVGRPALRNALRKFVGGQAQPQVATRAVDRAQFLRWNTSAAVLRHTGRAPFASTLRPNLTGGALPRTAGGYAVPGSGRVGGARFFSHTPAAQAQVVQDVAQAFRAFWLQGKRAHFDGCGADGRKQYRVVSAAQDDATRRLAPPHVPGAFVDFRLSPTITALSPLAAAFPYAMAGLDKQQLAAVPSLNQDGLLDLLSTDFERALRDLNGIMSDLRRLSGLGDLPLLLEKGSVIRVRFPGVDAGTVERLCEDLEVQRGIVGQDEGFDAMRDVTMALRFPFAPTGGDSEVLSSPGGSLRSHQSELSSALLDDAFVDEIMEENSWLHSGENTTEDWPVSSPGRQLHNSQQRQQQRVEEFDGLEGIYRFIQECDRETGRY